MRAALLAFALLAACDSQGDECSGAFIEPFPIALNFGDVHPATSGTPESAPRRKTVLLHNTCGGTLRIERVCIVEDAHDGVEGDTAFEIEGPDRAEVGPGDVAGIRVTFEHVTLNTSPTPGAVPPDRAALIVQTNAENAPTVAVPLCARLVAPGSQHEPFECPQTFPVPPEGLPELCAD